MSKSIAPFFLRLVTPFFHASDIHKLTPAPRVVFILSTGRTGTKYIGDLLNQLPGVVSVQEPRPSRVLQAWTSAFLESKVSRDVMANVLYNKRVKLLGHPRGNLYVESNHFIDGFIDVLPEVFDNPIVIHIVRDPRTFVPSMINRGNDHGWKLLINKYVPFFAYAPEGVKRSAMTPIERESYHWVGMNRVLADYGAKHPENYHLFKFEGIFESKNFRELLSTIGITNEQYSQLKLDTYKNPSRYNRMPKWEEWSKADQKVLLKICGPLMKKYGY